MSRSQPRLPKVIVSVLRKHPPIPSDRPTVGEEHLMEHMQMDEDCARMQKHMRDAG